MFGKYLSKFRKRKGKYGLLKKATMISPADRKTPIKVAGYLEKRSKMRVVCRWKKLWFVLEGRLLLYYKSQLEYLSLSPCRGTVNLGLAANVCPGKSNEIIVSTRSNTVSLRALSKSDHDIWLQALMDAMHLPNSSHAMCCTKPVRHFRYSTGGLEEQKGKTYGDYILNHAHTLSGRLSPVIQRNYDYAERRPQTSAIDVKLGKLAQRFSKIAASDTTIPENFKKTSRDSFKTNLLRRSVSVEDEVNRYSENIYETVDSNRYMNNYPRRVIRSDSDRLMMREKVCRQPVFRSEQRIKSIYDSINLSDHEAFIDMLNAKRGNGCEYNQLDKQIRMKFGSNFALEKKLDRKSDIEPAIRKQEDLYHSSSSNTIYTPTDSRNMSSSHDCCQFSDYIRSDEIFSHPSCIKSCKKPKRSNSILRHFMRNKSDVCSPLMKKQSVKRRSLSFLKKIWKKKEPTIDDDISFNTELDMQEIHRPLSDVTSSSVYSAVEMSIDFEAPLPEPPPDYGQYTDIDDTAPALPPRLIRGPTPWDDPPQTTLLMDEPPALPPKQNKKRKGNALDFLFQDGWDPGLRLLFKEPEDCNNQKELGEIMAQLADINAAPLKYVNSTAKKSDEDPDYDIPRPHDSLLGLQKTMQTTNFFSPFEDSLDTAQPSSQFDEHTMAPDSLECDPWSLSEGDSTYERWTPDSQIRKTIISSTYGSNREIYFKDTIKLPQKGTNYINMPTNGFIQLHS